MMQNFTQIIAARIKQYREERNWSQQELAEKLLITRPTLSKWENGQSEPSSSQLAMLAQLFNVSIEMIFGNAKKASSVIVVDTSIFIKTPIVIEELVDKFDEVVIPDIVIQELNNLKDKGNSNVKQRAWLAMVTLQKYQEHQKVFFTNAKYLSDENNDTKIANVAKERAKKSLNDKVYMYSNDVLFSFLVTGFPNLESITPEKYQQIFNDNKTDYNVFETQKFTNEVSKRNINAVKNFKLNDIEVNIVDSTTGWTPLIIAIRNRDYNMVDQLLQIRKIDINAKDKHKYKFTPLLHACQLKDLEMMKILVEAGADVNMGSDGENQGNTPLMVCAWGGFIDGVKYLMEQDICFNQQDSNGFTALHKACIKGYYNIAELLIGKTDIKIRDKKNKTADKYIDVTKEKNRPFFELFEKYRGEIL